MVAGQPDTLGGRSRSGRRSINKIRYVIEQVIANFKTWRIMHTDYRRPLATFPENHLSRGRPALLRNRLNNPQYSGL